MASDSAASDHERAFTPPPPTNLAMHSNVLAAGGDINIVVGAGAHDLFEETLKLAEWLSPMNSPQTQKDVSEKVLEGTGGWIFEQPQFVAWIKKEKRVLWGSGIPGAGKTCLTSIVINHLKERHAKPIYVYCLYKEQLTVAKILACLLRQAVLGSEKVATHVFETLYKSCRQEKTTPSKSELLRTLHRVLQLLNDVCLVVDALDELENNVRPELVNNLVSLQQPLFMTSRPLSDLPHTDDPDFTIQAQDKDVHDFVSTKIDAIPQLRSHLQEPEIREEVVTKIQRKCQGMFLLAALQIDVLASGAIVDRRSLRGVIEQLPTTLNELYELTLERIKKQPAGARTLACCAIVLVTHATRTLRVDELLEALTVDIEAGTVDKERRTTSNTLVSVSCGLLTVEKGWFDRGTVRLIHYTAQHFFESLKDPAFDNPHGLFADISAIYMSQAHIDYTSVREDYNLSSRGCQTKYPFISYAWSNLGQHAYQSLRYCNGHIPSPFSELARNRRIIPMSLNNQMDYGQAIHFAAFHGLVPLFEDNQQAIESKSSLGCSPLFYACLGGQSALAERIMSLLGPTLDFGTTNHFGATVLHAASQSGDMSLLARLLPKWYQLGQVPTGVQWFLGCLPILLDGRTSNGQTSLHVASSHGHMEAVKALLSCNDMLSAAGQNVILLDGSLNMAKWDDTANQLEWFLSNTLIDVNARDNQGKCPLHLAVENGHEAVVRLLLDSPNINVTVKDRSGLSPLHSAAWSGRETVARLLLDSSNIDVNAKDEYERSPLHLAAEQGHETIVRLLLNSPNININAKDDKRWSPLHSAAINEHETVVRLLLDSPDIDVNAKGGWYGSSPLHSTAENGYETVVRLLLDSPNIDVNAQDISERTPLHSAAGSGHEAVVRLLLDSANIDVNAEDWAGCKPLPLAVKNGHEAVVRLLLNAPNIDVNAHDYDGSSPLYLAVKLGHKDVVRLLLDSPNIDINAKDMRGWSPLHHATYFGHEAVIRLLLGCSGIETHVEAPVYWNLPSGTPLEISRKARRQRVVEVFEEMGFGDS